MRKTHTSPQSRSHFGGLKPASGPLAPVQVSATDPENLFRYPIGYPHVAAFIGGDETMSYVGRWRRPDGQLATICAETKDLDDAIISVESAFYYLLQARYNSRLKYHEESEL